MSIQDSKRRERIFTHHKTVLIKEVLLEKLPGWNMDKLKKNLESLEHEEVIETSGNDIKIFNLPANEKTTKKNNKEEIDNTKLTEDETELLMMLLEQSISC